MTQVKKTSSRQARQRLVHHHGRSNTHYSPRLRPLAAALIFALNGSFAGSAVSLGAIAAGGYLVSLPRSAIAAPGSCTGGTNVTCSGNQSAGIASGVDFSAPPVTTLNVTNLTGHIIPSGKVGIQFLTKGTDGTDETIGGGSVFGSGPDGGTGAVGGNVTVYFVDGAYKVITSGDGKHGLFARSIGGGGGDGGWATGFPIPPVFVVTGPAYGGNGGAANNGGSVYVNSNGGITTGGEGAHGILAESRGGSGGDGGWAFSTTYAEGGDGGGGASGGNVTVVNQGVITTTGEKSRGVYAFSVGGKGGAGGQGDGIVGAGGAGEGTGNGGVVAVANYGQIKTEGEGSEAILANSTGGGGGGGGGAGGIFTFGGDGASAGHGGMVTVLNQGRLETQQDNSSAIFAQSLGGGGGNGGGAIAAGPYFSLAIGGDGGPGGLGGAVDVDSHPASASDIVLTKGNNAHGIHAQSTGGGGGNGGYAVSVAIGKEVAVAVAVGGKADGGSDGGRVDVNTSSTIQTQGQGAYGVFADSTGGGGGNGGTSVAGAVSTSGVSASISVGGGAGGGGNSALTSRNAQGEITKYSVTVLNNGKITTGHAGKDLVKIDQLLKVSGAQLAALDAYAYAVSNGAVSTLTVAQLDGLTREELAAISGINDADADAIKMEARTFMQQDAKSYGIYARGIGGGGGDGGLSVAGSMAFGPGAAAVALGGSGNVGGKGGSVKVTNAGDIETYGESSHAIMAQSLGGGGGNGGGSVAGTLVATSGNSLNASVSVGGAGKGGGIGEAVYVVNDGTLTTHNIGSYGIKALSGGGGGGGGGGVAGSLSVSPGKSATIGVSVGGAGGAGNEGGDVTVLNRGRIETFEESSHSIFAQSVGGKGGNGGFSVAGTAAFGGDNLNVGVSVGGSGGTGSTGGKVTVTNQKDIVTHEGESYGVFAQSIGGGGGTGGASFAASAIFYEGVKKDAKNVSLNFAFGGNGGSGNEGGEVVVNNTGVIHPQGFNSHGVFAQSIGGGGGQGGSARTMSVIASPCAGLGPAKVLGKVNPLKKGRCAGTAAEFNLNMGGTGDKGGDGGAVTITNTNAITTEGVDSHGIWAQSVGGGGGSGGEAAHGWYGVPLLGLDAPPPWQNISITMGGSAGSSGKGGVVTVDHQAGKISTGGDGSFGIYAQSVGGGGGQGGHGAPGLLGTVGIGGAGGSSGDGGIVTVKLGSVATSSEIQTGGNDAHGIFAQSVGGGGGLAGNIERGLGAVGLNFGIGAGVTKNGGNAGNGGAITVTSFGNIATKGRSSMGIFAQSVGGGGGLTGEPGTGIAFVGSAGGNGTAGKVTVNHTGNITTGITGRDTALIDQLAGLDSTQVLLLQANGINTVSELSTTSAATLTAINGIDDLTATDMLLEAGRYMNQGDHSHGIFAQSGGGQQHNVDILDAGGTKVGVLFGTQSRGGDVEIDVDGDVIAYGTDANGIYAHSQGGDGNGNIKVTVNGRIQGGSGDSVGVNILDGASNSLTIKQGGTVTTLNGLSGWAIRGTGGAEQVDNFGTVIGSIDLGAGNNRFDNKVGSRLDAGATLKLDTALAPSAAFINSGTFSPGGVGTVYTTAISSNVQQTSAGEYVTDLDFKDVRADYTTVSGTSTLDGKIKINPLNIIKAAPGSQQFTILSSAASVIDRSNLALSAPASAVLSYELLYPNPNDVALGYTLDFTAPAKRGGFNNNRVAVGNHINAIQAAGSTPAFGSLVETLIYLPDDISLGNAYDRLSSEPFLAASITTVQSDLRFADALHSCRVREGEFRFVNEGECSWIRLEGGKVDQDRTSSNMGFKREAYRVATGEQRKVNENWHVGFGLSFESSNLGVGNLMKTKGEQFAAGVIAKRNDGPIALSASFDLGYGAYDNERFVNLPTPGTTATSENSVKFASSHLRMSRDYEQAGSWYLRQLVDLGVTYIHQGGFNETGAGAANLRVKSRDETRVSLMPSLELGREFATQGGTLIRPYGRIGVTHFLSGTTPEIAATLEGAPVGTSPFTVEGKMDKSYADLTLGVDTLSKNGMTVRVSYTGQFSENTQSHAGFLKLSVPF